MKRFWRELSLAAQVMAVCAAGLLIVAAAALVVTARWAGVRSPSPDDQAMFRLELVGALAAAALVGIGLITATVRSLLLNPLNRLNADLMKVATNQLDQVSDAAMPSRDLEAVRQTFTGMVRHLRTARDHFEESQRVLATRTSTVDRLLDFSQTIQGAGTVAQVYDTLSHYLRTELGLAGLVVISHEPAQVPAMQVRARFPDALLCPGAQMNDLEASACPCLRQHLPKSFRRDGSPVRCGIDALITLGPEHPAYCIPFNVGQRMQAVVHMLLPTDGVWTEDRRQLAQTYVNTAVSTLISLHLLAEAEKQSMTDGLTQLFNRRSMEALLDREVALSERHGHALSLVIIDLDHFKQINDAHGHAAGDHVLKSFADCVRITLRKTDLAFRYGGDEFVIALPQTSAAQAVQVVHKLRQAYGAVDFSHAIARLEHSPTLSIGVVERNVPQNVTTLANLLSSADLALYEAKAANRNCVRVFQPGGTAAAPAPAPTQAA
ncbi:MAG TPA: GGDEF domain-containing protein [Tepidisphaeraceae bacterium]|nr:GGDEF domain-containing protein [Tepidisphaeraceae bacterium]